MFVSLDLHVYALASLPFASSSSHGVTDITAGTGEYSRKCCRNAFTCSKKNGTLLISFHKIIAMIIRLQVHTHLLIEMIIKLQDHTHLLI